MKPTPMRWRKLLNKWWQGQPLERPIASKSKMNATTNSATSSATSRNETTATITTTTTTTTSITLNCLVLGEDPTEQAFPITIPGESTVAELKEVIKFKKAPEFNEFPANKLISRKMNVLPEAFDD